MNTSSQAVANYLLDLGAKEQKKLTLLPLMKLVYLTHGFSLAYKNKSALDRRFDVVESWKYGPVIPCLYHELKHFGKNPITEKAKILDLEKFESKDATLKDKKIQEITEFVWKVFKQHSPQQLVDITHLKYSPWWEAYKPNSNNEIEDEIIKNYFKKLIKFVNEKYEREWGKR